MTGLKHSGTPLAAAVFMWGCAAMMSRSGRKDDADKPAKKTIKKKILKRTNVLTTERACAEPVTTKPIAIKRAKKTVATIAIPDETSSKKAPSKKPRIKPTPEWTQPRGPRPKRRSATERATDPPPATGAELIERVSCAIERELNQIELIVGGVRVKPTQRTEAERRARTLASLARTLNEVARLRAQHQQRPDDDDAMPRDLDEFRETLARRLERLLADEPQSPDGDVQSG